MSTRARVSTDPLRSALEQHANEIDELSYELELWREGGWSETDALPWIDAGIWNAAAADWIDANGFKLAALNIAALDGGWRVRWLNGAMGISDDDARARFRGITRG